MSYKENTIQFDWSSERSPEGMRRRFHPSARINQTFFSMVPWINVILLAFAVVAGLGTYVVIPGMPITLTKAPFQDGFKTDFVLLVVPEAAPRGDGEQKVQVFFQDESYKISDPQRRERFCSDVAKALEARQDKNALLYVDASVEQAGLIRVMDVLRETEIEKVNVVVKP